MDRLGTGLFEAQNSNEPCLLDSSSLLKSGFDIGKTRDCRDPMLVLENSFYKNGFAIESDGLSPVMDRTVTATLNVSHFGIYEKDQLHQVISPQEQTEKDQGPSDDSAIDFTQYTSTFI